ncbi:hypothetical protein ACFHYQ_05840 [Sphaerimonospora cavernae]|uniref:Zinc transporter ZupT n=1 Tax=Sphaerimonospora cavernae TaxID=1740611 RepID=A0ABV6U3T9_9ACTN
MPISDWARAMGPVLEEHPAGREAWAAVLLVCAATLAGAWLARRNSRRVAVWLAMASAVMLVTALVDLLPGAWFAARRAGTPLWWLGLAAAFGFLVITYFTRKGCGHPHGHPHGHAHGAHGDAHSHADDQVAARSAGLHAPGRHRRVGAAVDAALFGGLGTAAALTLHRGIEGATLALTASTVVVIALAVHSASEGLALAALLDIARQRLTPWLVVACVSPAVGVLSATFSPLPDKLVPVLLSMVMGVLLRTSIVGLRLAAGTRRSGRLSKRQVAIAVIAATAIGVLLATAHDLRNHEKLQGILGMTGNSRDAGHDDVDAGPT